ITLQGVPPALITTKGISWLASQAGKPINTYVRDVLNIKVCVIRAVSEEPLTSLTVSISENEKVTIAVDYPEPRSYNKSNPPIWRKVGSEPEAIVACPSSSGSKPPLGGEVAANTCSIELNGEVKGKGSIPIPGSKPCFVSFQVT
ncbi:hypothetical protein LINPERPRIM_LOCUS2013, partial [Linum perenne]